MFNYIWKNVVFKWTERADVQPVLCFRYIETANMNHLKMTFCRLSHSLQYI